MESNYEDFDVVTDLKSNWRTEDYRLHVGNKVIEIDLWKRCFEGVLVFIDHNAKQMAFVSEHKGKI